MKPCMPGRNISTLLNLIYFENLFRDIGFSSSYCFVPKDLSLFSYSMIGNPLKMDVRCCFFVHGIVAMTGQTLLFDMID